jgi:hypothetical protein
MHQIANSRVALTNNIIWCNLFQIASHISGSTEDDMQAKLSLSHHTTASGETKRLLLSLSL